MIKTNANSKFDSYSCNSVFENLIINLNKQWLKPLIFKTPPHFTYLFFGFCIGGLFVQVEKEYLYIGTFAERDSKGIYVF